MQLIWKKTATYFLGISLLGSGSAIAWETGWIDIMLNYWGANNIPTLPLKEQELDSHQPDLDTLKWEESEKSNAPPPRDLGAWIDSIEEDELHTSLMAETTAGYSRTTSHRPSGSRIGCICMDNDRQDSKGAGACGGHGGVRFWLYQQANGSILEHPTRRHKNHPSAFSSEELSNLSSYNNKQNNKHKVNHQAFTFFDMVIFIFICLTVAYIAKLWWGGHSE